MYFHKRMRQINNDLPHLFEVATIKFVLEVIMPIYVKKADK